MGVTITRAQQRDERRVGGTARRPAVIDPLLVATTLVAMLAIGLAFVGQRHRSAALQELVTVNLSTVEDARPIEEALGAVLANPADRGFAARQLLQLATARRLAGDRAPNVEAILGAGIPVETIQRTRNLAVYGERLQTARDAATRAGRAPPTAVRLLTTTEVSAVKPAFTVRTSSDYRRALALWSIVYVLGFYAVVALWWWRGARGDRLLLSAAHLLTAIGFAALVTSADALRDSLFFERYVLGVAVGLVVMGALSLVDFRKTAFLRLSYLPLAGALLLSVLLVLFGQGPGTSGAKVNLGPVQPIEAIRLLLALFLAGYFARRWELLRQVGGSFGANTHVLPVVAGVGAALLFFFLQKDLGPALFLSCVFLVLYAMARGRLLVAVIGFAVLAAGFYVGYRLNISHTLAARVAMWRSPWDNVVRGGDQVAHAVWALATGGVFGTGLGLGDTRYLPAGRTDLPLAAIGEELGFAGLAAILVVYAVVTWRGFRVGIAAASDYGFFLATAVTLFLVVPVVVMLAGMLGLIPLTGVVTPFLSYGGSAMCANFAALGTLASIRSTGRSGETAEPFFRPVGYLGTALAATALTLLVVLLNVQLLNADEFAVRPHFGIQADGVGRYQYNPRVMSLVRELPRGSVFDRAGLVLATSDAALAARAREEYQRLGVTPNATCTAPIDRCYPLGDPAFHLLGDATLHLNWAAANTSYVEREAEDRLRGFNDHSAMVTVGEGTGRAGSAVRHDYRELVPLLRHRYDRSDESVQTFLNRDRNVRLAIDARLQLRVARILASAVKQSASGKAAAVVLDPDTGELLAAVSYPWPDLDRDQPEGDPSANQNDALLDRARYGLYPPGSIFKLVTAAAALRKDPGLSAQMFTCGLLPDGRFGVRIPGGRAVRDDVLDGHPHGRIAMHDGMVHSCNAYFAQLALQVGPDALAETASILAISVAPAGSIDRLRATLPQAGYGQGDVVVTPLRMARVAAALADDGVLREARLERPAQNSSGGSGSNPAEASASVAGKSQILLPPSGARLLASYMRDVVLSGTGKSLARHPGRIAGKTGTAEVAGAASHSWFVGFAPYGAATKRIAFAVIIENAGYGSLAAAPVAGEIVSAATALGLTK